MSEPKIVLFDLETIPDLQETLHVWPQLSDFPGRTFAATITSVCCFGYRILGEKKSNCISLWDFPEWKDDVNNDKPLLKAALEILQDADAVITHNGKSFDWKCLQTRLLIQDLDTLPKINNIDTKNIAKSNFKFFSNSLKYLCRKLTKAQKIDNEGWPLWEKVHGGLKPRKRDRDAEETMAKYCIGDVDSLEELFQILKKHATNIPNHNLFVVGGSKNICPNCGSTRLAKNGTRPNKTRLVQRYYCKDCGTPSTTNSQDLMPRTF